MVKRRREWWYGLACWNALSRAQQRQLIELGTLEFGHEPEGDRCDQGATVAIETMTDEAPGVRFYCTNCAIAYLEDLGY